MNICDTPFSGTIPTILLATLFYMKNLTTQPQAQPPLEELRKVNPPSFIMSGGTSNYVTISNQKRW